MDTRRIALAGGLAVAAFFIFTQVRQMATPQVQTAAPAPAAEPKVIVQEIKYEAVLAASMDIPQGTRLTPEHLKWEKWPLESVTPNFIVQSARAEAMEELTGSIARTAIYTNEPLSERKLVKAGNSGLMAVLLRPGMRAVTTRISVDTAAGGFIQPGDHVDIILTTAGGSVAGAVRGQSQFISKTIFEDVKVLAIDQTFSVTAESDAAKVGSTATFEMSQEDAELLQQSSATGDLTLTLRPMSSFGTVKAKSHAKIQRNNEGGAQITLYRNGQPQTVALTGQ